MIDTPYITQTTAQLAAAIHVTIPRGDIGKVMGPGLGELMGAIAAQGIAVTGPWFTHHLRIIPDLFDFEICVPVAAEVAATGRVQPSEWPAMTVARTIYTGPYEGLGAAWGEFDAWIAAEGYAPGKDLWERYIDGPESKRGPSTWRTELNRQVNG